MATATEVSNTTIAPEVGAIPLWPELLKAADLLRERGWCTHVFTNAAGELCLRGAINVAMGGRASSTDRGDDTAPMKALLASMGLETPDQAAMWNNRQSSAEPVIETLEKAAWGL